jgi:hypothetical protein
MPLGVIDAACKLIIMHLSDRYNDRTAFAMGAMCLPFVGGMIMLLGPQSNRGVLLFGCKYNPVPPPRVLADSSVDSLIGAAGTGWGLTMASLSANTVGYTKKATTNAVQIIGEP